MDKFDVVIIGGAVSGCRVAEHCAKAGLSVAIVEEDPLPGKYGKCTSIVSKRGLDSIGVDYSRCVLNKVSGADIYSGESKLRVRSANTQAVVLDRFKFDEQCAKQAKEAGAQFFFNRRFCGIVSHDGIAALVTDTKGTKRERFECSVLVGADGVHSTVAKDAHFPDFAPNSVATCYEWEYDRAHVENPEIVDVFLNQKITKGFFGWAVPCGKHSVRIGLGTTERSSFFSTKKSFLDDPRISPYLPKNRKSSREFAWSIPLGPRAKTQWGNVILVGDAAGQVKATTGGGIVFGSKCAAIAADQIIAHIKNKRKLDYESAWRKAIGGKLSSHRFLRSVLDRVPLGLSPALLGIGSAMGLGFALEKFGDMDEIFRV